jgi:4-hydroxy-4-methyl-2-oxoglutarate aldolase
MASKGQKSNLRDEIGKYSSATLFEASPQVASLSGTIVPLYRPIRMVGLAYPVLVQTGDNSTIHLAVAKAPFGSVLVVATGQDTRRGYWGEILMEAALARGICGLVIDGGVRDTAAIRERSFPVFSGATAIPGTTKDRPGLLNRPVMVAGVLVRPSDIVVGDDDGVVVIPSQSVGKVLRAAKARVAKELAIIERIKVGQLTVDIFNLRSTH